jgi:hypothetical protein
MKTKYSIIFLSLISIIVFFSACKYEEGPFISLRSKEKRLIGLWELNELKINDVSYLSYYNTDTAYLRFSINLYSENMFMSLVKDSRISPQMANGAVELVENKSKLRFILKRNVAYLPNTEVVFNLLPVLEEEHDWTILKLKNNNFTLSLSDNDSLYYLDFLLLEDYVME